jgi:L-threonylcarbamoyladenylate synthase
VTRTFDCAVPRDRERGLSAAAAAVARGALVVVPTDTVYGVSADAFSPDAVADLLAAKGRDRAAPPPVLIGDIATLDGLATQVPTYARDLVEAFWPGGLTVVLPAQPTLAWDLGDTNGTVSLRMPLHPVALELLAVTGPLATSGANVAGMPAPTSAAEAREMLGGSVVVYLDGGPCLDELASTIVDCTGPSPRLLRAGAVPEQLLREVVADGWDDEPDEPAQDEPAQPAEPAQDEPAQPDEPARPDEPAQPDGPRP